MQREIAGVIAFGLAIGAASAPLVAGTGPALAPSPLLAIDQNRITVVDRIVGDWGSPLEASDAGLSSAQLREMLEHLRADHLLAASLAGTLPGLRDVLATATTSNAPVKNEIALAKALGDANADLVYTPVAPCRLFDTRPSQGGTGTLSPGGLRSYGATAPVTNQGGPGACAAGAGAVVALIQIGTVAPAGNGLLQGGPQGAASFPNALILYQPGDQYGTAVAMPLNAANGQFTIVAQFAATDAYGDLLGYFKPASGFVASVSGGTGITVTGTTSPTLSLPASFQLPQSCANGQVPSTSGGGIWTCATAPLFDGSGNINTTGTFVMTSNFGHAFKGFGGGNIAVLGINSGAISDVGGNGGVYGISGAGFGVGGESGSGDGVLGVSSTGYAGHFYGRVLATANISSPSNTITTPAPSGTPALSVVGNHFGSFNSASAYIENTNTSVAAAPALRVVANGTVPQGALSVSNNGSGLIARFGNNGAFVSQLDLNGNWTGLSFTPTSDRNAKENFRSVDSSEVLAKVAALPISRWNFRADRGVEHIGPMAQDFRAAFGTGADERHIATVDADGVALAAIQGLHALLQDKDREIAAMKRELAAIKARLGIE